MAQPLAPAQPTTEEKRAHDRYLPEAGEALPPPRLAGPSGAVKNVFVE